MFPPLDARFTEQLIAGTAKMPQDDFFTVFASS
jgi:hypothetical protein